MVPGLFAAAWCGWCRAAAGLPADISRAQQAIVSRFLWPPWVSGPQMACECGGTVAALW